MIQAEKLLLLLVLFHKDLKRFSVYLKEYCESTSGVSIKPAAYADSMGDNKDLSGNYGGVRSKQMIMYEEGEYKPKMVQCFNDYYESARSSETRRASFSRIPNLRDVSTSSEVARRLESLNDMMKSMSKEDFDLIALHYSDLSSSIRSKCAIDTFGTIDNAMRKRMERAINTALGYAEKALQRVG